MNENAKKLGFIGAGNMATAMIKGLIQSSIYEQERLVVSDKSREAMKGVSDQFGVKCLPSNKEVLREALTIVLAVKPQNMREVLQEVKGEIRDDHLIISIAAGIPLKMIREILEKDIPLIRVMPNTPALVQKGMSALARGQGVTAEHMATAIAIFNAVGDTVEVEESMMDAVTAVSGSGPGYVFRFMECLAEAGTEAGLERDISLALVVQTFLGAAHLAKTSEHSLSRLREMVTSPGGTTEAGLGVFNNMGLEDMTIKAVDTACKRSVELGKDY